MNLKELKELIDLIQKSEVTELELEKAGVRVRIKKQPASAVSPPAPVKTPSSPPGPVETTVPQTSEPAVAAQGGLLTLKSPVVGTFYRSPTPDAEPYVEVGSLVKKGQILCVIEAMKLMNEIESESDGKIVEILIENAQSVEYGEPLFRIDPLDTTEPVTG